MIADQGHELSQTILLIETCCNKPYNGVVETLPTAALLRLRGGDSTVALLLCSV